LFKKRGYNLWARNNPKKRAIVQLKNYHKNKWKHICRMHTRYIFLTEGKSCKRCGTNKQLQIYHEVYPKTNEGIRKAISDGKIYMLCNKCHKANI